jgi:hypothetical protein
MCLGNDGDIFVANRGNENGFGQPRAEGECWRCSTWQEYGTGTR